MKQKTLICLFVFLCIFHIIDIRTHMKLRDIDNNISYLMISLEEMQTNVKEQKILTQEQYDLLYDEVQNLHIEVQNMDSQLTTLSLSLTEKQEEIPTNRWDITLTEDEIDLLARIVMLEAGGESVLGQEAVVEVIFNRIYHEDFPNTLEDVLSEPKQFSTWKNRNTDARIPTEEVYQSIDNVLSGKTHILPYYTVYFARTAENDKEQITIGNHVFCNQY